MQKLLKLIAFDEEDLGVLSFHVHNAHVQVKDIIRQADEQRFMLVANRFDWAGALAAVENADDENTNKTHEAKQDTYKDTIDKNSELEEPEDIPALLCFDHVSAVRSYGIDRENDDRLLTLKGLCFRKNNAPSGTIEFLFTEDVGLQCDVECIEGRLEDLAEKIDQE